MSETSINGADTDFCTVTPKLFTSCGNCDCACETRSCVRIWSMFGSVATLKFTVRRKSPLLALVDVM